MAVVVGRLDQEHDQRAEVENKRIVRRCAREFLGHVYDIRTHQFEDRAVADFPDDCIRLDSSVTKYVATLHHVQELAEKTLGAEFNLNIGIPAISLSFSASAGHRRSEGTESSSLFCAVAYFKVDRCSFRTFPIRLPPRSDSLDKKIIKSGTLYVGYRIVLELLSHEEKTDRANHASLGINAPTLTSLLGGGVNLRYENHNLSERKITQVNIKEITGYGYDIPVNIHAGLNPTALQEKLEQIRQDFLARCCFLERRQHNIDPYENLGPLREMPPLQQRPAVIPRAALQAPAPQSLPLPRDETYFTTLAQQINETLDLAHLRRAFEIHLDRMLFAMDKAFTNLLAYMPEPSGCYTLILGEAGVGKSIVGASLMGADLIQQHRLLLGQPPKIVLTYQRREDSSPLDFPEINYEDSELPSGIRVYGRFLETPILADFSKPEYDLCYGIATACAIARYRPTQILVVLKPKDLDDPIKICDNLMRVVYNPFSPNVQFIINDPQQGPCTNKSEAIDLIGQKLRATWEEDDRIKNSFWRNLLDSNAAQSRRFELMRTLELIRAQATSTTDLEANIRAAASLPIPQEVPGDLYNRGFDLGNLVLHNSFQFKIILDVIVLYFASLENNIANLQEKLTTHKTLLTSIDKICALLRKGELHKIDLAEAARVGAEIDEEVRKSAELLQEKERIYNENTVKIRDLTIEIDSLRTDTTHTELELHPHKPIQMRRAWEIPPFGTEYKFSAQNYTLHRCEFKRGKGTFSCTEEAFRQTKQVLFTPKWPGYQEDLRVQVLIWIDKKEHPNTLREVNEKENEKRCLEGKNPRLRQEITSIKNTIQDLQSRELSKLEERKVKLQRDNEPTETE